MSCGQVAAISTTVSDRKSGGDGDETKVNPPAEFPFPFKAYDLQRDFMRHLFECIEHGNMGIFESPTGTGKSMSLICGSLAWLKANRSRPIAKAKVTNNTDELDWVSEFTPQQPSPAKQPLHPFRGPYGPPAKRQRTEHSKASLENILEDSVDVDTASVDDSRATEKDLIVDYESGDEAQTKNKDDYLDSSDDGSDGSTDEFADLPSVTPKIIYCSRTHSQISQFVGELKQSPYGEEVSVTSLASRQQMCINPEVKALGSQSRINDRCLELKDKKGKKTSKTGKKGKGCPYYNLKRSKQFLKRVHNQVRDIEDLVFLGSTLETCPYYGARRSVPLAEIVCVPYNTLLHAGTREASGLTLNDSIVIVDEAHNLIDTLLNVYSVHLDLQEVIRANGQLSRYFLKYKTRLSPSNITYIQQLLFIMKKLIKVFAKSIKPSDNAGTKDPASASHIQPVTDFVFALGIDNINLFKLVNYCQKAMLVRKLNGFVDFSEAASAETADPSQPPTYIRRGSALAPIVEFLIAMQGSDCDGRIMVTKETSIETATKHPSKDKNERKTTTSASLKYLVLSAADKFTCVLKEARAVILCGGTMSPYKDFADQLIDPHEFTYKLNITKREPLPNKPVSSVLRLGATTSANISKHADNTHNSTSSAQKDTSIDTNAIASTAKHAYDDIESAVGVTLFSCDHVIPPDNLIALAVGVGPTGKRLSFTYENRQKIDTIDELGRLVLQTCRRVPDGVVCFFASYDYATFVYERWETNGMLKTIAGTKTIFREARGGSQQKLDDLLIDYARCIRNDRNNSGKRKGGALLLSVVGGKLSEGINFKDELGRCVLMIGLPFPNKNSPELKERMQHLDSANKGCNAGSQYYTSLCMRAVNQCIGRAIRHKDDYAGIVLVDDRYRKLEVQRDLPNWIRQRTFSCPTYGYFFQNLAKFCSKMAGMGVNSTTQTEA